MIGAEFYVMERVKGIILRAELPPELNLDEQQTRSLCKSFIDKFVELHNVDYAACGLAADLGRPDGYVQRPDRRLDRPLREGPDPDAPLWEPVKAWLGTSSRPITTSRASCTTTTASTT
ncbi:phosphotransferase [Pseudomonas aeruginosa]|nr:phosphotransferase [Pseudomonas aeruginosa]